jgi:hypothetical protein
MVFKEMTDNQRRYKAILVDIDEYAKELSRYIQLNPCQSENS